MIKRLIFAGLSVVLAGCATTVSRPGVSSSLSSHRMVVGGRSYLPSSVVEKSLKGDGRWDGVIPVWVLNAGTHELRTSPQLNVVLVDGQAMPLSTPPILYQGQLLLPEEIWSGRLQRWIPVTPVPSLRAPSRIKTIVVDAGHGGRDPGAIGRGGLREKEITLEVARRLRELLVQDGYKVIMTRSDDRFISLPKRSQIANQSGGQLFVSIHANASRSRSVSGFEAYYLSEATDDHARALEAAENTALPDDLGRSFYSQTDAIVWDMLYTEHRAESTELAHLICQGMRKEGIPTQNRGIKSARFAVLKGSRMPSVLIEVGFVTHPKEESLLRKSSYRETLAQGIRRGISSFSSHLDQRVARAE